MIRDYSEIPEDATVALLDEQIRLRQEYLPRLTSRALVVQMREEISLLEHRRLVRATRDRGVLA